QALEQQRQILLRFRDFQAEIDRLITRMAWVQNRLLELKVAQENQKRVLDQQQQQLQAQLQHPYPHPDPQKQQAKSDSHEPSTSEQLEREPAPPPAQEPTSQISNQVARQEDDEEGPSRVQPCRLAKETNPCYLRETVAFSGRKTPKKK
ncbi:unnamed protein product, partial [Allacma fusca]